MSFDVFGARRDAQSWAIKHAEASSGLLTSALTLRGFTGHEQLDEVGLVHMGGRVYDPILGRFLQADPFIQQPNNTQNLNRYSYVLNNPLNATDPSGYFFQMLVMWAVQYVAAATAGSVIGTALGAALTAYQYYGYAQMAVGAIRAIEGGGTAMANFAGGMAKGYAKGMLFNGIMLGLSHLQNSASTNGPDAAKSVDNKQGSDSTDGLPQLKGARDWEKEGGLQASKMNAEEAAIFKARAIEARNGIKDFLSKLNGNDTDFKNDVAQFYGLSGAGDRDFSVLQDGLNTHGNEVMRLIDNAINNTSNVFRMAGSSHGAATGGRVYLGDPFWKGIQQTGTIIHEFSHVAGTAHDPGWDPRLALKSLPYMRRDVLYQMTGSAGRLESLRQNIKNTYFFEFAVTRL